MTITPVLDVQTRIAAIAHGLAALTPGASRTAGGVLGASTVATASNTSSFAADLQRATEQHSAAGVVGGPSSTVGTFPGSSAAGAQAVATAKEYLGVPYVWGGKNAATGLDCSGLTKLVYSRMGIDLPDGSANQVRAGSAVTGLASARAGDLLFFGEPTNHVGIYAGDGKMVHAPRSGKAVEVSAVYETPTDIRRVLPASIPAATNAALPAGSNARVPASAPRALSAYAGPLAAQTPYAAEFRKAEAATGVPARVLAAVAKAESGFRPDAVSPAGARGLMQFMPATARGLGVDPMNPASAVDGAARLLKRHVAEFGSLELALAAYNAGQGSVRKYGGIPPYAETRQYVQKVLTTLDRSTS